MKNYFLLTLTLLFCVNLFSQTENIQAKLDSILKVADLMYK